MKILLAPTKTLKLTQVNFLATENQFNHCAKKYLTQFKSWDHLTLQKNFAISEKLSQTLHNQLRSNVKGHAFFSYQGLTYKQIKQKSRPENFLFINDNFLILDALFIVLRPFDLIPYYRLDFSLKNTTLKQEIIIAFKNNYHLSLNLNEVYINLASKEYAQKLDYQKFNIIDIEFLNYNTKNELKINATRAKIARGKMADFIIKNQLNQPHQLQNFEQDYLFSPHHSTDKKYVFISKKIEP